VYTFTKLHDRRIPKVHVGVTVGPMEFQLYSVDLRIYGTGFVNNDTKCENLAIPGHTDIFYSAEWCDAVEPYVNLIRL